MFTDRLLICLIRLVDLSEVRIDLPISDHFIVRFIYGILIGIMLLVYRRRRTKPAAGRTETIPPSAPELTVTNTPSLSKASRNFWPVMADRSFLNPYSGPDRWMIMAFF
jgi:hypothetical protein